MKPMLLIVWFFLVSCFTYSQSAQAQSADCERRLRNYEQNRDRMPESKRRAYEEDLRNRGCLPPEGVEDQPCVESGDEGTDRHVRGTVSGVVRPGGSVLEVTDLCMSIIVLREYTCEGGLITSHRIDCRDFNERCEEGVCVANEPTCDDPDGRDPNTRATVSGINSMGIEWSVTEACSDIHLNAVVERTCTSNHQLETTTIFCGEGEVCLEGACIPNPATCADTEEGQNPNERGVVSGVDSRRNPYELPDTCNLSGTTVVEIYCDGNIPSTTNIPCTGHDIHCADGMCTSIIYPFEATCEDTDRRDAFDVRGTVSGQYHDGRTYNYPDSCPAEGQVREYYCDPEQHPASRISFCPADHVCQGGTCALRAELACSYDADTDGGVSPYRGGCLYGVCDRCIFGILTEHYCTGGRRTSTAVDCPMGCEDESNACLCPEDCSAFYDRDDPYFWSCEVGCERSW